MDAWHASRRVGVAGVLLGVALAAPSTGLARDVSARAGRGCPDEALLPIDPGTRDRARAALYCLVAQARAEQHATRLYRSTELARLAQRQASDMATHDYFSHTNRLGQSLDRRVHASRYPRKGRRFRAAETLSWGIAADGTPRGLLTTLLRSSEHRKRLLGKSFRDLGVGISTGIPVPDIRLDAPLAGVAPGSTISLIFGRRR